MRSNLIVLSLLSVLVITGCDKLPFGNKTESNQPANSQQQQNTAATSSKQQSGMVVAPPALPQDTLAMVGNVAITKTDLEMRITELKGIFASSGREWQALNQEQLSTLLADLVTAESVAQLAKAQGIDQTLEAKRTLYYAQRNVLSELWFQSVSERVEVSSEEIESFYNQNKQGFREPERIKVSQIIVKTQEEAKSILAQLLTEQITFEEAARQHSEGPTAANGGVIPIDLMRGAELIARYGNLQNAQREGVVSLEPSLESAVFSVASVGGVSSVTAGPDGRFHVYRLDEKTEAKVRSLDEVWDNIKNGLKLQKIQQRVDAEKASAKIEQFPERLQEVVQ